MKYSFLDAVSTSIVAMIIVFALLIILQYIIKLQSFILNLGGEKPVGNKANVIEEKAYEEAEIEEESQDDLEIVAVIAAALSAYLDVPEAGLKIKSIKRVNNNWSQGI